MSQLTAIAPWSVRVFAACVIPHRHVPSEYTIERLHEIISQISDIEEIDIKVFVQRAEHPEVGGSKGVRGSLSRRDERY